MVTPRTPDPIVAALDQMEVNRGGNTPVLPGKCTPAQIEAIRVARRERGLSYRQIATALKAGGIVVSEGTVAKWLRSEGLS